ncbi:MAG: hypothetical protein RR034_03825 [Bacteroidales bacterium]
MIITNQYEKIEPTQFKKPSPALKPKGKYWLKERRGSNKQNDR